MQNPQQLPHHPLSTHTPTPSLEPHPQALEALPQEAEEHDLDTPSVSETVTRYHHRRGSSTRQFRGDDEEGSKEVADRKNADVPRGPSLKLMPLPTIETVMERLSVQDGAEMHSGRGGTRAKEEKQMAHPVYKTVIHVPKPPDLVRRNALDAAMLKRVFRERARLQLDREQEGDDDPDVTMEDCDERESTANIVDGTLLATSPTSSFYTAASTWSMCTSSSSSDSSTSASSSPSEQTSPSPVPTSSPPSPAYSTTGLPPTSAYPSPPCSPLSTPIYHSLSPPPSPTWKPQPLEFIPSLDLGDPLFDDSDDEMDWDWSMNGGEVVYGAAGLAVSPRVMIGGGRNVCCHCQCGMDTDMDMELYVIDEESEEESEVEEE